jgi:CRP-like cAMP-binding protein
MAKRSRDPVAERLDMDPEIVDQLLRWFARQPREVQLECTTQFDLAALVRGAETVKKRVEAGQAKKKDRDLDGLSEAERLRIERIRAAKRGKPRPKGQKIYKRRALIERLLKQGCSWPEIAEYMRRHAHLDVTASYLRRTWQRIQASPEEGKE